MIDPDVVVFGGSAGALEALLAVLPAMPEAFTVPIVVVLHLPAEEPSLVPGLLARACPRPVVEIEDKQPIRAATIHVAPPNYHVLLERSRTLALSVDPPVQFSRPSIDVLFESAADSCGPAVIGVLLSGANDDGARGLARIAQAGGRAVIQDPATAPFATMPAAAVRLLGPAAQIACVAGLADLIAAPRGTTLHQGAAP
jgi:two-component system chemotaxis response regulator CheB